MSALMGARAVIAQIGSRSENQTAKKMKDQRDRNIVHERRRKDALSVARQELLRIVREVDHKPNELRRAGHRVNRTKEWLVLFPGFKQSGRAPPSSARECCDQNVSGPKNKTFLH
mmetsp:Transcript_45144/g.119798  ORF Transcript_45144/g.119798 Transcript_45144/m.119798 type:complete len:115 (-) Transcript_45144:255-599(-)